MAAGANLPSEKQQHQPTAASGFRPGAVESSLRSLRRQRGVVFNCVDSLIAQSVNRSMGAASDRSNGDGASVGWSPALLDGGAVWPQFGLYKTFIYFEAYVHESIRCFATHHLCLGTPTPLITHTIAQYIVSPRPLLYCNICHTILVMTISCKRQATMPACVRCWPCLTSLWRRECP